MVFFQDNIIFNNCYSLEKLGLSYDESECWFCSLFEGYLLSSFRVLLSE